MVPISCLLRSYHRIHRSEPTTPPIHFHGSDSFTVSVTDDQNHSATLASVTLTITSVDDATIITGDFNGTLLEDGNVTRRLECHRPGRSIRWHLLFGLL